MSMRNSYAEKNGIYVLTQRGEDGAFDCQRVTTSFRSILLPARTPGFPAIFPIFPLRNSKR